VPGGFVPAQDKQYLIGFAQLPDGATLDRTEEVIRRMGEITKKNPNVEARRVVPGPVDQRLHQQLELGHRVRHAQALRPAQAAPTRAAAPSPAS
jgi:multidrug efflux pump subunit AcrB